MNAEEIPIIGAGKVAEVTIFRVIWTIRSRQSFLSGLWLRDFHPGQPLWFNLFAHVLAKGQNKYPFFRFYYKNIILLTPNEHFLLDQGTEEQRISYSLDVEEKSGGKNKADWGRIEALRQELLQEYDKYFPRRKGLIIGYKYSLEEQQQIVGMLNEKYIDDLKKNS